MHSNDAFIPKYSELVCNGFWFSPEREALQTLVTERHPLILPSTVDDATARYL
jgi:argininosuccinate synthase